MPGGDGTGPMGIGPRMGRGRGMCGGRGAAGMDSQMGLDMRCRGRQRRGMGWPAFGEARAENTEQELQILQRQAETLTSTLESLRTRIEQLQGHRPAE
jgi:hypothetical protein